MDRTEIRPKKIRALGNLLPQKNAIDFSLNQCLIDVLPVLERANFGGISWHSFRIYSPLIPPEMTISIDNNKIKPSGYSNPNVATITVTLKNVFYSEESPISNHSVYLEENGNRIDSTTTNSEGVATFKYSSNVGGAHELTVYTLKQGRFTAKSELISIFVMYPTKLELLSNQVQLPIAGSVDISAKLTSNNLGIYDKPIHFLINNKVAIKNTNQQGIAIFTLNHDNEDFPVNSKSVEININSNSVLESFQEDYVIKGVFQDNTGVKIFNYQLNVYKYNNDALVGSFITDSYGNFTFESENLIPGKYFIEFEGNWLFLYEYIEFEIWKKTTTNISTENTTVFVGDSFDLIATVSPNTISGSVIFYDGDDVVGTSEIVDGEAILNITADTKSTKTYTAKYEESNYHRSSTSSTLSVIFNKKSSSCSLEASKNQVLPNEEYTLTAILPQDGTGSVIFYDGDDVVGTSEIVDGEAILNITADTKSTKTYTAKYTGNYKYEPSTSNSVTVNISKMETSLEVELVRDVYVVGDEVTFEVFLTSASAQLVNKTIHFKDPSTGDVINTKVTDEKGFCTFNYVSSVAGTYRFEFLFEGDDSYNESSTINGVTIGKGTPSLSFPGINAGPYDLNDDGVVGAYVPIAIHVDGINNLEPTGNIVFKYKPSQDGNYIEETVPLDENGDATTEVFIQAALNAEFTQRIEATYSGDNNFINITAMTGLTINSNWVIYDSMTSDSGNWTIPATVTHDYNENGLYITGTSYSLIYYEAQLFKPPFIVDFTVTELYASANPQPIFCLEKDGALLGNWAYKTNTGVTIFNTAFRSASITTGDNLRTIIEEDTISLYKNGSLIGTVDYNFGSDELTLRIDTGASRFMRFKDWRIIKK